MSGISLQLRLPHLDVDLSLPGRGISAIIGPSGAGKTTLLRAVAGLGPRAPGRVEINGEVWQNDSAGIYLPTWRRRVAVVFQEPSLFLHLSVRQNIEFGMQRIRVEQRVIGMPELIAWLGIGSLLERKPATLSGGEKQRVAIARALATNPALLLMDEPLAALDAQRKAEILPCLEQLHVQLQMPIMYVTHAIEEAARLADYVVSIDAGKVRASGSVFDMLNRSDLSFGSDEQAFTVIPATVTGHDPQFQLLQVSFAGGSLWLASGPAEIGAELRLRIMARDVSLSLQQQIGSSILNSIAVTVFSVLDDGSGLVTIALDAKGSRLLCRITRKSVHQLQIVEGMSLFAQIKGVAILK